MMAFIILFLFGAVSLQNFEIDHNLDMYEPGGALFLAQDSYLASSYSLPDTYVVDLSDYTVTVTDIKITLNFTSFSSSFTPTVASNNITLTSTSTDKSMIKLEYHYQCTQGATGSIITNATTNSIIYTLSWDFDPTTQAPLVNYYLKEFKLLANVDDTQTCTPPQQGFSDFLSQKFMANFTAAWEPHPPTWGAKTFENDYLFSMLNDQGVSENFKLTLTKSTVTPPLFSAAPVAFKYTYAVTFVPPSEARQLLEQKQKPSLSTLNSPLKASQSVCTIIDAALLYNITSGSLKNTLKDAFAISWANIPDDTQYPFPSMQLRQLYLIYPSIIDLQDAKNNMTFDCTFTAPVAYMLVTSLSYTLQASCVVNKVDAQGAATAIWTDTFTISADASITTESTDACSTGTFTIKSVLSPITTLSSSDSSADRDKLDLPVLQEFQKLAYSTFLKNLTATDKIPNFAPTCFNPVMSGATAAPTVTVSFTGVKACFDVDFSS